MLTAWRIGTPLKNQGQLCFFFGVCYFAIFAIAIGALVGTTSGASTRELARSPILVGDNAVGETASLRLKTIPSWGPQAAHGYLLAPTTTDAPLPPGMATWIGPGEVLVSAALAQKYPIGATMPLGRVVGTIATDTLSNPRELFFYSRPAGPLPAKWGMPASGFGGGTGSMRNPNGDLLNAYPLLDAILFLAGMCLLPGTVLIVVSLLTGYRTREVSLLLKQIGVKPESRFLVGVSASMRGLLPALVFTAIAIAAVCTIRLPLPLVDFVINPADMRAQVPLMLTLFLFPTLIAVIAAGVNALVTVRTSPVKRYQKLLQRLGQFAALPTLAVVIILCTTKLSTNLLIQLCFWLAIISLTVVIPVVAVWVAEASCALLKRFRSNGANIVAAAKLRAHGTSIMSVMLGISLTLVLLSAAQMHAVQLGERTRAALSLERELDNRVAVVRVAEFSSTELNRLAKTLSNYGGLLAISAPTATGQTTVFVDQTASDMLSIPAATKDLRANAEQPQFTRTLLTVLDPAQLGLELATNTQPDTTVEDLYILSATALNLEAIEKQVAKYGIILEMPTDRLLAGATINIYLVNWLILFGTPAALALITASIKATHKQASQRLRLGDVTITTNPKRRTLLQIVGLLVTGPGILTAIFCGLAYFALSRALYVQSGGYSVSAPTFQLILVVTGIMGAAYSTFRIFQDAKEISQIDT